MTVSLSSGCAPVRSDALALPDIVAYTPAIQARAADELEACPAPTVMEFMKDYGVMRDQTRAAQGREDH